MTQRITTKETRDGLALEFDFSLSQDDAKAFQAFTKDIINTERERVIGIIHGFHIEEHVGKPSMVCKPCRIIVEVER